MDFEDAETSNMDEVADLIEAKLFGETEDTDEDEEGAPGASDEEETSLEDENDGDDVDDADDEAEDDEGDDEDSSDEEDEDQEETEEPETAKVEEKPEPASPMLPAEVEAIKTQFTQSRDHALQVVNVFTEMVEKMMPKPPARDLAQEDPFEYSRQKADYDAQMEELQQAQQVQARLQEDQQKEAAQQQQIWLAEQQTELKKHIPEWFGDDAETVRAEVAEYAVGHGLTPERLGNASAIELLFVRKAQLFDKGVEEKVKDNATSKANIEKAKAKGKKAIPVSKPGAKKANGKSNEADRLRSRARRSGSVDDVAALIANKL
jgi:hypothetical protein